MSEGERFGQQEAQQQVSGGQCENSHNPSSPGFVADSDILDHLASTPLAQQRPASAARPRFVESVAPTVPKPGLSSARCNGTDSPDVSQPISSGAARGPVARAERDPLVGKSTLYRQDVQKPPDKPVVDQPVVTRPLENNESSAARRQKKKERFKAIQAQISENAETIESIQSKIAKLEVNVADARLVVSSPRGPNGQLGASPSPLVQPPASLSPLPPQAPIVPYTSEAGLFENPPGYQSIPLLPHSSLLSDPKGGTGVSGDVGVPRSPVDFLENECHGPPRARDSRPP